MTFNEWWEKEGRAIEFVYDGTRGHLTTAIDVGRASWEAGRREGLEEAVIAVASRAGPLPAEGGRQLTCAEASSQLIRSLKSTPVPHVDPVNTSPERVEETEGNKDGRCSECGHCHINDGVLRRPWCTPDGYINLICLCSGHPLAPDIGPYGQGDAVSKRYDRRLSAVVALDRLVNLGPRAVRDGASWMKPEAIARLVEWLKASASKAAEDRHG